MIRIKKEIETNNTNIFQYSIFWRNNVTQFQQISSNNLQNLYPLSIKLKPSDSSDPNEFT